MNILYLTNYILQMQFSNPACWQHMPDKLSPAQRSTLMARVRSKDTGIERMVRSALHRRGRRFRKHVRAKQGSESAFLARMILNQSKPTPDLF